MVNCFVQKDAAEYRKVPKGVTHARKGQVKTYLFVFALPSAPVTSIVSVVDQLLTDTHHSPIRIKAVPFHGRLWSIVGLRHTRT